MFTGTHPLAIRDCEIASNTQKGKSQYLCKFSKLLKVHDAAALGSLQL